MSIPAHVQSRLKRIDKALSLKEDGPKIAVLRNGVKIGAVERELLGDGSGLIAQLKASDLWEQGGAQKVGPTIDYEEQWSERKRKEKRLDHAIDEAKDVYDDLARRDGRRVFNAGMPA